MAHGNERKTRADHDSTNTQEELNIRHTADATGRERGDMPDTPDRPGVPPDADNTADPKPFPSKRDRSGPGRKFEADEGR